MTVRGSFHEVLSRGKKMPKGKPYHDKSAKKAERKEEKGKPEDKYTKNLPRRGGRKVSV